MEIKTHIIKSHEQLSQCNVQFLNFVRENPGSLRAENYYLLELNDPLFKLQPWPTFIDQQVKNEMKNASLGVLNLLRSIPGRIFSNDYEKISQYYGISLDLAKYFFYGVTDAHLQRVLSRGDFILSKSGWKCLEFNVNTNLGGLDLPFWESLYLATPTISDFMNRFQVKITNRNLFTVLLEHLAITTSSVYTHEDEINIAFIPPLGYQGPQFAPRERYFNSLYHNVLQSGLNHLTGQVFFCDYSGLKVKGDDVLCNGKKIHHIVEWCDGFVPDEILALFKNEKILICNGTIAWLLSTKLNLALLSETKDSGLFSPEEKEIIEKYIPWTRKVTPGETTYHGENIQLEEFIRTHQDKLILKPLLGTGGKDIYVGRYTSGEKWKELVDLALSGNDWKDIPFNRPASELQWSEYAMKALRVRSWVVQEYFESPTYLYQLGENGCAEHHMVWGFFIFGNTYAGGWARVMPTVKQSGVINCHQGARVSVAFEVE